MATKKRSRKKTRKGCRARLLLPVIILALLMGWLYRSKIMDLVTFRFKGSDFTRPPVEDSRRDGRITERDRKELEKILENR